MSRRKPETIDALTDFFMFADYAAACVARDRVEMIMGIRKKLECDSAPGRPSKLKPVEYSLPGLPVKRGRPPGARKTVKPFTAGHPIACACVECEIARRPAARNAATEGEPTQ